MDTRETIVTLINADSGLRDLGLAENAVYQADTVESPTEDLFVVIRWLKEQSGIGRMRRKPFDVWVYTQKGDYTPALKVGDKIMKLLDEMPATATDDDGWIAKVETALPGLGRGMDLFDDGYDMPVIPFSAIAIASGL